MKRLNVPTEYSYTTQFEQHSESKRIQRFCFDQKWKVNLCENGENL